MNNPPNKDDLVSLLDAAVKRFNDSNDGKTLLSGVDLGLDYPVSEFRAAHEQAISHRLAFYLEDALRQPDVNIITDDGPLVVDCEYNQHQFGRKLIQILKAEADEFIKADRTALPVKGRDDLVQFEIRPDILIHQRGIDWPTNLMVLEVKRWTNTDKKHDQQKLMLLSKLDVNVYGYVLAAAVYARNDLEGVKRVLQVGPRFHGGEPC
jgi:hypothetical protein